MTRLAVIGNPVAHSRSPEIHTAFALQAGVDVRYVKILAPLDGFRAAVSALVNDGGLGFNVTVPFKREAFELCDETTEVARQTETVNTVSIVEGGRLKGDSTDGAGLVRDLRANLGWRLSGKRILVLGAGGAVSAILPALVKTGPSNIDIYNRTHARAETLAARHGELVQALTYESLGTAYDIVISGTSAGLSGDMPSLPPNIVGTRTKCYDLIYASGLTTFNRWATETGCQECSDGLGMLVEQAALAFEIWFDFKPDTREVIRAMRSTLEESPHVKSST